MFGHIFYKRNAYCTTCKILKKRLNYKVEYDENKSIDQLIKDTMICLEDDDFENANRLIDKVDIQYASDPNIEFITMIIDQSLSRTESDYEQTLCY